MGSVHCSSQRADDVFQFPVVPLNPTCTGLSSSLISTGRAWAAAYRADSV